jgi:hypothetical protein
VSKGHFLVGDGIVDSIFGHRSSLPRFAEDWVVGLLFSQGQKGVESGEKATHD